MTAVEHIFAPNKLELGTLPYTISTIRFDQVQDGWKWNELLRGDMVQVPGRNRVVALPSGHKVWECELRENEQRNEAYRGDTVERGLYLNGETIGFCFGICIPKPFPTLPNWGLMFQIHPGWTSSIKNPLTTLAYGSSNGGGLRWQNDYSGEVFYRLDWAYGHFNYYCGEVTIGNPAGHMRLWHAVDRVPNPSKDSPVYDADRNTGPPDPAANIKAYTEYGLYQATGPSTTNARVIQQDGLAQTGSAQRAYDRYVSEVCNPAMVADTTPPPPPGPSNRELVAAAKAELEQTTISGKKWVAGGRGAGHWRNAYTLLDKITD